MNCFESVEVINFEDFTTDFGQNKDVLTIICVATHYEGEPCDNTVKFHKHIKSLKSKPLQNLNFTIFGLGDTAYE